MKTKRMVPPKIDWVAEENQRRLAAKSAMTGTGIYVQPHSVAGSGDGRGQAALSRQPNAARGVDTGIR